MSPTVVILLSDKRSGSTMFQRELCKHPDIQTVAYSPHAYLETHHWLKAAVMLNIDGNLFSGGKVYPGYGSRLNARTYMEDCLQGNLRDYNLPSDSSSLIYDGWEAMCRRFATPVFFEKSPQYLAHWGALELLLQWIRSTSFDVKVVGLVRNPLSVMYSAQELFHSNPDKRQYGWVRIHQNLERFASSLNRGQFELVRYEDIIASPEKAFANICHFIGVEPCVDMGSNVHDSSIDKWVEDPFFQFQLANETREMAARFGYGDEALFNPEKPLPPLLQRFSRKVLGSLKLAFARLEDRVITPIRLRRRR